MTIGLYIDPGVHALACAKFHAGELVSVAMEPREAFIAHGVPCTLDTLVIEKMRVYPNKKGGEDPNDLIEVTGASYFAEAALVSRGGPRAQYVLAADWKGGLKKPIHHRRVWSVLTGREKSVFAIGAGLEVSFVTNKIEIACKSLARTGKVTRYSWEAHNLLDAVGLGLWHLKRVGLAGHRFSPLQS